MQSAISASEESPAAIATGPTTNYAGVILRRGLVLAGLSGIPVVLLSDITNEEWLWTLPWFLVAIYLYFMPALWDAKADLFAPPLLLGVITGLALVTSLSRYLVANDVYFELLPHLGIASRYSLARTVLAMHIIGVGSYYTGYYLRYGKRLYHWLPKVEGLTWQPWRLYVVIAICAAISIACYAYFQARIGAPLYDVTQLAAGKRVWRSDPTTTWLHRGIQLGFLPLLLLFTRALTQRSTSSLILAGISILIVGLLVTRVGQRGYFIFFALCVVGVFHYLRRRVPLSLFIILWFFAVVGNSVFGAYRKEVPVENIMPWRTDVTTTLAAHEEERARFSALAVVAYSFPDKKDYLLGESWIPLFVALIPRWLWPNKSDEFPWSDTRIVFQLTGAPIPTPYIGTLYANLSWLGIVMGMFLWGMFHRGLYEYVCRSAPDANVVIIYVLFLVYFGPTLMQVSATLQYVVPTWIFLHFMGIRKTKRAKSLIPSFS